jgi:predicted DNA-binding transcriptional regulator YafY
LRRYSELARFVDEALRHLNLPMLRYLLAAALIEESRMATEAAQHVQLAETAGFTPPFPHRNSEWHALEILAQAFPKHEVLNRYRALAAWS